MNIKERDQYLMSRIDVLRFGGGKEEVEKTELDKSLMLPRFDWYQLTKPPILYYIPQMVIDQLYWISTEPRLMNNGKKKFDLMNQTLQPYGFYPLASGTNRRAFYCVYDPSIILKIGSDRIGRSDNLSEFYIQQFLKPYCCKIYEVHPSGIVALSERVETMKEEEFKTRWASEVFDLIMILLYKGYIMEDIGGNYFKNWAVRIGFGPVLIDFPYIYNIDYSKLRCIAKDKYGIQCGGELDYDYQKGMSEIVCQKCGKRYAANYLAKLIPDKDKQMIYGKEKVFRMANMNGFQFNIKKGDTIIHSSYREIPQEKINRPVITVSRNSNEIPSQNYQTATEEVKPMFRASITRTNNIQQRPPVAPVSASKPLTEEEISDILDLVYKTSGKRLAIGLARMLNVYYKDPTERNQNECGVQPRKESQPNQKPNIKVTPVIRTSDGIIHSANGEQEFIEVVEDGKTKVKPVDTSNRPTTGLFPTTPKSDEELQKEYTTKRQEKGSVLGIPGEPYAVTMKIRSAIPAIKQMIRDKFDNKIELKPENIILEITRLEEGIKELIGSTIKSATNTESVDGLDVMVNTSLDSQNKTCFAIEIEHYKSPILQMIIYPMKSVDEKEPINIGVRKIASGINTLDTQKHETSVEEYLIAKSQDYALKYHHLSDNDFTSTMAALLVIDLQKDKHLSLDEASKIVDEFIAVRTAESSEIVQNY